MTDDCHIRNPGYPFVFNDGGRKGSRRAKQKNDCTVRALSITTGMTYDEAYDHLQKRGRKASKGFFFPKARANDQLEGYRFVWRAFPAERGKARMNPATFCKTHSRGTFILRTAKHVVAVVDGVVHDTLPEAADRCIYGCWQVLMAPAGTTPEAQPEKATVKPKRAGQKIDTPTGRQIATSLTSMPGGGADNYENLIKALQGAGFRNNTEATIPTFMAWCAKTEDMRGLLFQVAAAAARIAARRGRQIASLRDVFQDLGFVTQQSDEETHHDTD